MRLPTGPLTSPYVESPGWRRLKWGTIISLRRCFEFIDDFTLIPQLLKFSTKSEILEVLLTDILVPRELNPVLTHLETTMYHNGFIPDQETFNELECQLDMLAFMIDKEILRQSDLDIAETNYELVYWLGEHEAIIGEFDI